VQDYELIAQRLSALGQTVQDLEEKVRRFEERMADIEKVNARLEDAALTTARALQEISGHWDAVYEAMRRRDSSQEAADH
jgi:predicted  nucleic acid-binding Zn-ribbon protein